VVEFSSKLLKTMTSVATHEISATGMCEFTFDKVRSGLFGMDIPVPTFSSGTGYVGTSYFDGNLWVEAYENAEAHGGRSYNVYLKDGPPPALPAE